ncbi:MULTISPECIES: hypothetical protein [unclassified Rhodanobacter]|jgi:hypothetical protein|nr:MULTISPECIES: hypothetical protein [unclassified Rhodanobacter]MBB6241227.1 hypothetical protein [Rhodanobacter sp. MP1X3]MBB6246835.1 hypothetical protein [Rhodanobacter sp. A1T4]
MLNNESDSGFTESGSDDWVAMEGERASGVHGGAPDAMRQEEPDPSWQPL